MFHCKRSSVSQLLHVKERGKGVLPFSFKPENTFPYMKRAILLGFYVSPFSIILSSALSEFVLIICPQGSRCKRLCHGILLKRQKKKLRRKFKRQTENEKPLLTLMEIFDL